MKSYILPSKQLEHASSINTPSGHSYEDIFLRLKDGPISAVVERGASGK
jgi:hypothetical protein